MTYPVQAEIPSWRCAHTHHAALDVFRIHPLFAGENSERVAVVREIAREAVYATNEGLRKARALREFRAAFPAFGDVRRVVDLVKNGEDESRILQDYIRLRSAFTREFTSNILQKFDKISGFTWSKCDDCGKIHTGDETRVGTGDYVCDSCLDHYSECERCGETLHSCNFNEYSRICDSCVEQEREESESSVIYPYGVDVLEHTGRHKPGDWERLDSESLETIEALRSDGSTYRKVTNLFLGVELEVISKDYSEQESAERAVETLGERFAVAAEDGSLSSGGFEIISVPSTHAALCADGSPWRRFLKSAGTYLKRDNSCGMHVHASRAYLSSANVVAILLFIHDDANADAIETVAGRSLSNSYCKGVKKTRLSAAKDAKQSRGQYDRYEAVNLQNPKTLEFRLFASTVSHDRFLSNVDFVAALCAFVKTSKKERIGFGFTGLNWLSFSRFVNANKERFAYLYRFMDDNGLIMA